MLSVVSRYVTLAIAVALTVAVATGPAIAQQQQLPGGSSPSERPGEKSPGGSEKSPGMGMLEGSVKNVDPGAGTVQVSSGPFGILGRTLEVNNDTQIQVEGRQGTLADLREGSKVKASYESRDGKNIATQIEVMPADQKESSRTPLPKKSE